MNILHIGGVADGEMMDLPGNAMTGRQSFKLSADLPSDPMRHHDYERQIYMVRESDGTEKGVELMVWTGLPKRAAKELIQARLGVQDVS